MKFGPLSVKHCHATGIVTVGPSEVRYCLETVTVKFGCSKAVVQRQSAEKGLKGKRSSSGLMSVPQPAVKPVFTQLPWGHF